MSTSPPRFAFYPGCCGAVGQGTMWSRVGLACCEALGLDVSELAGWTCCGGPELVDQCAIGSAALAVRNVALACKAADQVVTICPACVSVMRRGMRLVEQQPGLAEQMTAALAELGLPLPTKWRVRHLLTLMTDEVGRERVVRRVLRPLTGIRVACYYGCGWADPSLTATGAEKGSPMETLMQWLGADVAAWKQPGGCCSRNGHGAGVDSAASVLSAAARTGAECIGCACPLCAAALDRAAEPGQPQPVFFAQLVAGAFGLPMADAGLRISRAGKRAVIRMRRKRESAVS